MTDHTPDLSVSTPAPAEAAPQRAATGGDAVAGGQAYVDFVVEPKAFTLFFVRTVLMLVFLHLASQFARFYLGLDMSNRHVVNALEQLHLSVEDNLPSYFSALMLLTCAVLLLLIFLMTRRTGQSHGLAWLGLAALFIYLSIDEMLAWHEYLVGPLRSLLGASGLLYFAWVIPYGILIVVLALAYLRFVWRLPGRTRTLFALAALVFLSGALGFEMLGGRYAEMHGLGTAEMSDDIGLVAYQTVEETLEMAGVVLFIYALSSYIRATFSPQLRIAIGQPSRGGKHDATRH